MHFLIVNIVEVIPPKVLGVTIDNIKTGTLSNRAIIQSILILIGVTIVGYGLTSFGNINCLAVHSYLRKRCALNSWGIYLKMTPTFYQKNRAGDLMARATNDLKAIAMTAGFGILTLVDSSLYMLTIVFMMGFTISWELTFAALIPLPIMAYAMNIYGKKLHERFTVAQDAFGDMNDKVLESIAGVRVIRAYVQENADQERFHHLGDDVYEKNRR